MGILEKLIVVLLVLFPFGELARISVFKDITLHPIDLSVLSIVLYWLCFKLFQKQNIFEIPNFLPFTFFLFSGVVSLVVNLSWLKTDELLTAFLYLLRLAGYTSIYFVIKDTHKNFLKKTLPRFLLIDGLIILVLGFVQLIFFPSLMSMHIYQWDKHIYRLFSVFFDPNYAGSFLVLYLIFVLTTGFGYLERHPKTFKNIYFVLSVTIVIAVFLTFSRSALIMLLISSIIYFVLTKKLKLIAVLIAAIILFVVLASPKFYIENLNLFRVNSSLERIGSAKIALQIIEKNPFFGIGFNAYRYAQVKYKFRPDNDVFSSHADAGTDNSLLFVAATSGVFGLITFLYFWFSILKSNLKKPGQKNFIYRACVIASIAGIFISAQFNNSLFYGPLLIWVCLIAGSIDSE